MVDNRPSIVKVANCGFSNDGFRVTHSLTPSCAAFLQLVPTNGVVLWHILARAVRNCVDRSGIRQPRSFDCEFRDVVRLEVCKQCADKVKGNPGRTRSGRRPKAIKAYRSLRTLLGKKHWSLSNASPRVLSPSFANQTLTPVPRPNMRKICVRFPLPGSFSQT